MQPVSRDRISVDVQGMKERLLQCARRGGETPSAFVRRVLAAALASADALEWPQDSCLGLEPRSRVRLSLRMSSEDARTVHAAARQTRLSPGTYVAGLVAGVPVLRAGGDRLALVQQLKASTAEVAALSHSLSRLTTLLGQGSAPAAMAYRESMRGMHEQVRAHFQLTSMALAELRRPVTSRTSESPVRRKGQASRTKRGQR